MEEQRRKRILAILWVIILLGGAALFLFNSTHESFWCDESFSYAITDHSLGDVLRLSMNDVHPPLYYILLWFFRQIAGGSIFALRLFSALGMLALVALGAGPVRRVCGNRVGLLFSFLAVVLPISLAYAQETRMYSWAAFFVAGCALYAYLAVTEGKRGDWIRFGAFTLASVYIHVYGLMAAFFINLLIFAWILFKQRERLKAYLITAGVIILAYLPWLSIFFGQVGSTARDYWIPPVDAGVIMGTLAYPFGIKFSGTPFSGPLFLLAFLTVLWGLAIFFTKKRSEGKPVLLAVGVYTLTFGTAIFVSHIFHPVLVTRYMMPLYGLYLLAIAFGLSRLRFNAAIIGGCVLLMALSLPQIGFTLKERVNGPMTEVAAYLDKNAKPGDVFVHVDEQTAANFYQYLPKYQSYFYLAPNTKVYMTMKVFEPRVKVIKDLQPLINSGKRVWLVNRVWGPNPMVYMQANSQLGTSPMQQSFQLQNSWYAVTLNPPGE